jgi:hypothetical protein
VYVCALVCICGGAIGKGAKKRGARRDLLLCVILGKGYSGLQPGLPFAERPTGILIPILSKVDCCERRNERSISAPTAFCLRLFNERVFCVRKMNGARRYNVFGIYST